MKFNWLKVLAVCMVAVLAGCGSKKDPVAQASTRILNLAPETGALSVKTGSNVETTLFSGIAFQSASGYAVLEAGSSRIQVNASSGTLLDTTVTLGGDTKSTLAMFGSASSFNSILLTNPGSNPDTGKYNVRLANLNTNVTTAAGLDVYIINAGQDIAQLQPDIRAVSPKGTSSYVTLDAGSKIIRITEGGTKDVVFDTDARAFAEKINYTIAAYSSGSARLVNVALLQDDDTGAVTVVDNKFARLRVINGASDSVPVIFKHNGNGIFQNVTYQGVSNYNSVAAGTSALRAELTTSPGIAVATAAPVLKGGMDYTVVLAGSVLSGSAALQTFNDATFLPPAGKSRIRFVNSTAGIGAVDVYANFTSVLNNLAPGSTSAYSDIAPGTYEYSVNKTGASAVLLTLPSSALASGNVYSVFLLGQPAATNGVLRQDN